MDYKKKYEDALERCKKEFNFSNLAYSHEEIKERLEHVFPELKESEDERIRKEIARYFKNYSGGDGISVKFPKWIAWLEKQDEQKPSEWIQWTGKNLKEVIDFTGKSPRFDEWFKSWDEYEAYVHSHGDILKLFCADGSHYEVPVGAWIVKTPDGYNIPSRFRFVQKSTEWSEEDDKILEIVTSVLQVNFEPEERFSGYEEYMNVDLINWLKSLKERVQPRQKQEWSEDDEEHPDSIIENYKEIVKGLSRKL